MVNQLNSTQAVVLAIDTAGPYLGLALQTQGHCFTRQWLGDSGQQEVLTPLLAELLQEAGVERSQIDLVAVMRGPGTFTGLRVGMAGAKALAMAWAKPLVSLSTLSVYGYSLRTFHYGAVVLDARKGRYYAQLFAGKDAISPELDIEDQALLTLMSEHSQEWQLCGYGAQSFVTAASERTLTFELSEPLVGDDARNLALLAWDYYQQYGADDAAQGPNYLRLSEAELSLASRLL